VPCPDKCSSWVAIYHTHGASRDGGGERFSGTDMTFSDKNDVDNYMGTPTEQFMHYPYDSGAPKHLGPL
jgi:hypothetical protein